MSTKKTRVIHCTMCDQPFPEKMEKHPPYFGQIRLFIHPTSIGGACDRMAEIHALLTRTAALQKAIQRLYETDCDEHCLSLLHDLSTELCDEAAARLWRAMNKLTDLIDPDELRAELGLDKEPEEHPDGQKAAAGKEE